MSKRTGRRAPQKRFTRFERETERRRREMLGNIAGRVVKPARRALKCPLWATSSSPIRKALLNKKPPRKPNENQR